MTSSPHWFRAENPLTLRMSIYEDLRALNDALRFDPLLGLDIRSLSLFERTTLLIGDKLPLTPTAKSLELCMTIHAIVAASYAMRNPTLPGARRWVDQAIRDGRDGRPSRSSQQAVVAPGSSLLLVKGETGLSKSVTLKHAARTLGDQVIVHSNVEKALWQRECQLLYLYVAMSHDGSRGGLLLAILITIDKLVGTSHAIDMPRGYKSIDKLAGAVVALLLSYYVGVLIIDEIQFFNTMETRYAKEVQMFFLSMSNSGIPLVLSGNPRGFGWINALSQNKTRAYERPPIHFHPCGSMDMLGDGVDDEWETVASGVRNYYVLHDAPVDVQNCLIELKRLSGGIPRVALGLWCQAQCNALMSAEESVSCEHIRAAYESFDDDMRALCDGFAKKDSILLRRWSEDVDVDFYAKVWGQRPADASQLAGRSGARFATSEDSPDLEDATPVAPGVPMEKPKRRAPRSAAATFKAQQTRERKKEEDRVRLAGSLQKEDMRINGMIEHALAGFDTMMKSASS
jgi:hypothetical protein